MTIDEIISAAGGVGKLAYLAGVNHSSVCGWRRVERIPVDRALAIHEALSIPLHEIRPDIWHFAPAADAVPSDSTKAEAA